MREVSTGYLRYQRLCQRCANVLKRLKGHQPDDLAVSSITWMEIQYGLRLNPTRALRIRPVVKALCDSIHRLSYDDEDANHSAVHRSELKASGTPIGPYDILIAGCALRHGLTLVTANIREFNRIPQLRLEDWRTNKT